MSPQRSLGEFMQAPEVSTATLHLEWHEVRRRLRSRKQVRVIGAVVSALAVLGVVAGFATRAPREAFIPGQVAATQETARTWWLAEGSQVAVAPSSEVKLVSADEFEVVLIVEGGRATFDVQKNPSRRFVVRADSVEVRVVGTKFTVQRDGHDVAVTVLRGIVEVREGEIVKRLTAGEHWNRGPELALAPEPESDVIEGEEEGPPPSRSPPRVRRKSRREVTSVEPPRPAASSFELPTVDPPAVTSTEPAPADTFAAAMRARGSGHAKEAMTLFQQVTERWPSSAYAPMSAFEWGRLALDSQDDPRQAARAFERTLELATSSSLIQDTLARLTEAYARYDVSSCRRAQAEYLRRFPGGPHARGVSKACPP